MFSAAAADEAADMLTVLDTGVPLSVTVAGLRVQLVPAGIPEQVKLTGELNPFCGLNVTIRLAIWPRVTVISEMLTDSMYSGAPVEATVTVTITAMDVEAALNVSPLYVAVMLWVPAASDVVLKLAAPPLNVPTPTAVWPSRNVTVPVGVALTPATVTLSETDWPTFT